MGWRTLCVIAIGCWMQLWSPACHAQNIFCQWLTNHDQRAADNDSFLQTDGPSFTRANSTVPQNMLQLETRYGYQNHPALNSFPQFDMRFGVSERLEVRAEWGGVSSGAGVQTSSDLEVGLKYLTSKQNGWIPQAALMVEVFTPTGYGPSAIRTIAPEIDYIFGWTLNSNWSIGGSTGAIFGQPGAAGVTQYYQSAVIERTSTDQHVQTFAEVFSLFGSGTSQGAVQPSADCGVLWRITHNFQLDWRVGMGLNHETAPLFTGGGATFRY